MSSIRIKREDENSTLQSQVFSGRFLVLILLMLLVYLLTAEFVIRTNADRPIFGIPSIGSGDKGFEGRLSTFRSSISDDDQMDCVVIGDSTVMTDFAPRVFADSFYQETQQHINCFNFGAGAFTLVDMAALAEIVVKESSPKVVIIGVESLNFAVPSTLPAGADFAELPWTQYKLGRFSIEGWLSENSALYSHLGAIRQLVTLKTSPTEISRITLETNSTLRDGFYPMEGPGPFDISEVPDPTSDHPYHENYFGSLSNFQLLPEHLTALDQIIALNSSSTQVVIVEMPVPDTFYYYFGNDEQDYQTFLEAVEQSVSDTPVPFLRTTDLELFPYDLWLNYNHLNARGAPIFSEWLGTQMGQAELNGEITIMTTP